MAAEVPKIVLTPLERSHHFGRRECLATEHLKVGRSVDRRRISPNNLIFDCRVLSRNHAQIWFENGKFYIKDTKSSNGTFVNENRLSPSGEESGAVELKSRDVVQFGVNVNVDKKVTHGCIIATVKLYMNEVEVSGQEPPVQQVMHILQAALSREQELENNLASMQGVLTVAKELAADSMIAIVKEDELMSRLEMMENQLQVYSRNATDDELKKQLILAFEDKRTSEITAKDALRNILQEKLECLAKFNQLQRDYDRAEEECQKNRILYDNIKQEHIQELSKLGIQLSKAETDCNTIQEKLAEEKQSLSTNLESVQAEADFTKEQLEMVKARLNETQSELVDLKIKVETARQRGNKGMSMEISMEMPESSSPDTTIISIIPPGTEDLGVSLIPPGTEESPVHEVSELILDSVNNTLFNVSPSSSSLMDRESVIMATPTDGLVENGHSKSLRVVGQDDAIRISQGRVRQLEERLSGDILSSLASTDVSRGKTIDVISSHMDELVVVAKSLSNMVITKSHIQVLQEALLEEQEKVKRLKDGQVEDDSSTTMSRLENTELSWKRLQDANERLEMELSHVREECSAKLNKNLSLEAENQQLVAENKLLQQKLDQLPTPSPPPGAQQQVCSSPALPCSILTAHDKILQRRKEEEEQHVRILTLLALVSIGVALASWLI